MFSVYALSRNWGCSKPASVFSAVTALLGGYFLSMSSNYNQFHSVVWFPLILLFYQKYIEENGIRYLLGASIVIAFQVLAGGPESAVLSVLTIYACSLFWMNSGGYREKTIKIAAVVFLSVGLSAIQWIPTYHLLEHLTRGAGISFSYSTERSMELRSLADIVLPENSQPFFDIAEDERLAFLKSIYMGLLPLFILLMGMMRFRKDSFARFWIITFVAGILLSLGKHTPVYFYIYSWVPFFDMFRFPTKFFFLSAFALVLFSGRGLDYLANDLSQRKIGWSVPLVVLSLLAGIAILIFLKLGNLGLNEALMVLGVTAVVCMAIYFNKIGSKIFLAAFLCLLVLDLMGRNGLLIPFVNKSFYTEPPVLAKRFGNSADRFRIFKSDQIKVSRFVGRPRKVDFQVSNQLVLSPLEQRWVIRDELYDNFGTIYNIAYADGIETMLLGDSALWKKIFSASKPERKKIILMRSNVKYQIGDDYEMEPSPEVPLGVKQVEEFQDTLPRAFIVGRSQQGREPHLLNTYYSESFDPLQEVLLGEEVQMQTRSDFSGQVNKITYSPNKVELSTEQNGEGFLVLLDTYFPGWKVEVDGKPEHIYRANYFYRGVRLAPGSHRIEFSYEPVGLKMGAIISGVTFMLLLFLYFKPVRTIQ